MVPQYIRQPRLKQFEVECFTTGTHYGCEDYIEGCRFWGRKVADFSKKIGFQEEKGEAGDFPSSPLLKDPDQKQYLTAGELPLLCPECGKEHNLNVSVGTVLDGSLKLLEGNGPV